MSQKKIPDGCDWCQCVLLKIVNENTSSKKKICCKFSCYLTLKSLNVIHDQDNDSGDLRPSSKFWKFFSDHFSHITR